LLTSPNGDEQEHFFGALVFTLFSPTEAHAKKPYALLLRRSLGASPAV
jgi:hypothetical protein